MWGMLRIYSLSPIASLSLADIPSEYLSTYEEVIMTNKVHHIEKDIESRIEELKGKAEEIEQEVEVYTKAVTHYIKKNPVKSTIIAGVAGIFLGKLLGK